MENRGTFFRDLLIKILFVAIFIFLIMYLFPMPNLTPFYSSIFNDNIQTMKDAAEDYYTTKRMPTENGKSTTMTLGQMLDKKLILPFVDKNGKSCDTNKSYVKVTKEDDEYVLKVSLTCSKESDYIIERIGCHNFCPNNTCDNDKSIKEAVKEALEEQKKNDDKIKCETSNDGVVTVTVPTGTYIYEYEYQRKLTNETWTIGDFTENKVNETDDIKLIETKYQYTGKKKVTTGTTLYEQILYAYKDNWTYGEWVNDKIKENETTKLYAKRTLYTGQKKVETKTTEYKHEKYGQKNEWTIDENWLNDKKTETADLKLYAKRTLYTGQKKVETKTTEYKHEKYGYKNSWTIDENWVNDVKTETADTKLYAKRTLYTGQKKVETKTPRYQFAKYGHKYTVTKDIPTTTTSCTDWKKDTTWYTTKPNSTSTKVYGDSYNSKEEASSWTIVNNSYKTTNVMPEYSGDYKYELLTKSDEDTCTSNCNVTKIVYYYRVYKKSGTTKKYQYYYKDCTPTTTTKTDTKVVTDAKSYVNDGYKITNDETYVVDTVWKDENVAPSGYVATGKTGTKTVVSYESLGKWVTNKDKLGEYTYNVVTKEQYKYAYNNSERYVIDVKWTNSITPPEGYVYANKTATNTKISYESLGKWVTNKDKLGEYTHNVVTKEQYKYAYNKTEKYLIDVKWTTSKTSPEGYVYANKSATTTKISYESLGKWVTNYNKLDEYTYNIITKEQYKYAYNNKTKYVKDTRWVTEKVEKDGYILTGKTDTTTKTTYIDLGTWVNSKKELNEYTYDVKTRILYKYKYRKIDTKIETIWSRTDPGTEWTKTGNSKRTYGQTGTKTVTRNTVTNKQK